jgi:hypothetical protein
LHIRHIILHKGKCPAENIISLDLDNVNSVIFDQVVANPSGTDTLWVNSADGHLMHGSTNLENVAVGPASSTDNVIVH